MELIEKALRIAVVAHQGQVRKSDGSPYIVHPIMVSLIIERSGYSEELIAAGLVHDVLEDTKISKNEIESTLGAEVLRLVTQVTEDKSLPWKERKEKYIQQVCQADESVKVLSLADKIHNTNSLIDAYGSMGANVWLQFSRGRDESLWFMRTLCDGLKQDWQHPLLDEFDKVLGSLESLPS